MKRGEKMSRPIGQYGSGALFCAYFTCFVAKATVSQKCSMIDLQKWWVSLPSNNSLEHDKCEKIVTL